MPERHERDHPILHGVNFRKSTALYGFNDVNVKEDGLVVAVTSEGDAPMLVVETCGRGRVFTFMSNPAGAGVRTLNGGCTIDLSSIWLPGR
jgi:uncharacterized membrane protein